MLPIHRLDQAGIDQGLYLFVQRAARAQPKQLTELAQGRRVGVLLCALAQQIDDRALASSQRHEIDSLPLTSGYTTASENKKRT
jgi:hypothetical protein